MNISGLSYLQFALVDGMVAVYLLLRLCETHGWSRINPLSVLRQGPSTRGSGLVTMLGYFCCVAATVLFVVKDGLMAHQEMQDVALCRAAVYLKQDVRPTDAQQMPVIKTGLLLWDLGAALQILALGCATSLWAARPLRRLLDPRPPMSAAAGMAMLGLGVVGCVAVIATHFVAFGNMAGTADARSAARLVSSAFALLFAVALGWVVVRVTLAVRRTRRRDPYATATAVSAAQKLHAQGGRPMATLQHLLGIQVVSFMNESAKLLVLVLVLRAVFFVVFDASFLSPSQAAVADLGASNAYTGLGTLATSLVSPLVAQLLLPTRMDVLADVLGTASGMSQPDRIAFIDAQLNPAAATVHMPQLTPTMTSRDRGQSSTLGSKPRSRAPTSASLAVEKLIVGSGAVIPAVMHRLSTQGMREKPSADGSANHGGNYLDNLPYLDYDTRESSHFAQGPWAQSPAYPYSPTPHMSLQPSACERDSSTVAGVYGRAGHDMAARPVTGNSASTAGGRQITIRHSTLRNNSMQFSDHGYSAAGGSAASSRTDLGDSYVPLPGPGPSGAAAAAATSVSVASGSQPSGPSLHAEALIDAGSDGRDSIVSAYMRPESTLPPLQRVIYEHRPSSFVSDDYQYNPPSAGDAGSKSGSSTPNPFEDTPSTPDTAAAADHPPVYVAGPVADDTGSGEHDGNSKARSGLGPLLLRKGSKASLWRKNTLDRHRQRGDMSLDDVSSGQTGMQQPREPARQNRTAAGNNMNDSTSSVDEAGRRPPNSGRTTSVQTTSRMSAFYGASDPAPAYNDTLAAVEAEEQRRDSSTISNMSWDAKPTDAATAASGPVQLAVAGSVGASYVRAPLMHHYQSFRPGAGSRPTGESTAPSSLFKHRITSTDSNNSSSDQSISGSSLLSRLGGNDAFYTPESSLAEFAPSPDGAADLMVAVPLEPPVTAAAAAQDNRPSTAPSSSQRHTVGASERVSPPADADGDDDAGSAPVRRAQTLRKAVDTDALALESSIHQMAGSDDAGALISALPLPAQEQCDRTPGSSRVLL
ncbi:hypothetical protein H4R19_003730 [Coemansia spiralis]|nr:hypothetical protein H4R19_003730 [Coemansia spiralis]